MCLYKGITYGDSKIYNLLSLKGESQYTFLKKQVLLGQLLP